jgi:hypothetical protein
MEWKEGFVKGNCTGTHMVTGSNSNICSKVERAMELMTKLYHQEINMNNMDPDHHSTNSKVLFAHARRNQ